MKALVASSPSRRRSISSSASDGERLAPACLASCTGATVDYESADVTEEAWQWVPDGVDVVIDVAQAGPAVGFADSRQALIDWARKHFSPAR